MANAIISHSYADLARFLLERALLKQAIGCLFCIRKAPILLLEASHSISNGCVKFGSWRTSAVTISLFTLSKVA